MKRFLPFILLLPLVIMGCVSGDAMFLVQNLDDARKAQAITQAGIEEFNQHLVRLQQFDEIPRVREYFAVALRLDPGNAQAQQYVTLIDNFKKQKLAANIKNADKLRAKAKRTDDENYTMLVSLQTAARIDPSNDKVKKALSDTVQDRNALVTAYLARSKAAVAAVDSKSSDAVREKQYTEAFQNANKALDVDPGNGAAQGQVNAARAELNKSVARRVSAIQKLIAAGSYADARTQVTALSDLNQKLDNNFDAEVRSNSYALNFNWADALYKKKDFPSAEVRVDAALVVTRTDEATALKRRIVEQRSKADASVSFESGLQAIDSLIASNDLVSANRKLVTLDRDTTDSDKQAQLDTRAQTIVGRLKDLYDKGVQSYRDEDFKTAIDLLSTVVGVQVDYEQAGDYLDKAKSKQKMLDQY
jgi:hypothetical protein